jgi:hypothetical protein
MFEKNLVSFILFLLLRYAEQTLIINSEISFFFKLILTIFSLIFDFLLGIAANEEEIQAIIYYITNLNHWRYEKKLEKNKIDTLYTENTFPLWIFCCSFCSKIGVFLNKGILLSTFVSYGFSFLVFFYEIDFQQTIDFIKEKKTSDFNSFHYKLDIREDSEAEEYQLKNFSRQITPFYWIYFIGFNVLFIYCFYEELYKTNFFSFFQIMFGKLFCIYPLLDCYPTIYILIVCFISNFPIFIIGMETFFQKICFFFFIYGIIIKMKNKIAVFMVAFAIFHLNLGIIQIFESFENNLELEKNVFIGKILIFLLAILFFVIIFRPNKKWLKYASFLKEMYINFKKNIIFIKGINIT